MVVQFDNLLGGGDLGDTLNSVISALGTAIFDKVTISSSFFITQVHQVVEEKKKIDCLHHAGVVMEASLTWLYSRCRFFLFLSVHLT